MQPSLETLFIFARRSESERVLSVKCKRTSMRAKTTPQSHSTHNTQQVARRSTTIKKKSLRNGQWPRSTLEDFQMLGIPTSRGTVRILQRYTCHQYQHLSRNSQRKRFKQYYCRFGKPRERDITRSILSVERDEFEEENDNHIHALYLFGKEVFLPFAPRSWRWKLYLWLLKKCCQNTSQVRESLLCSPWTPLNSAPAWPKYIVFQSLADHRAPGALHGVLSFESNYERGLSAAGENLHAPEFSFSPAAESPRS